jgi:hypothetical protein
MSPASDVPKSVAAWYTANESNINVWFPFTYSQKLNCYFKNRIIMFCLPVPILIYM